MKNQGKFNNSKPRNYDNQSEKRYGAKAKSDHQRTRRSKKSEDDFYDDQNYDVYGNLGNIEDVYDDDDNN